MGLFDSWRRKRRKKEFVALKEPKSSEDEEPKPTRAEGLAHVEKGEMDDLVTRRFPSFNKYGYYCIIKLTKGNDEKLKVRHR